MHNGTSKQCRKFLLEIGEEKTRIVQWNDSFKSKTKINYTHILFMQFPNKANKFHMHILQWSNYYANEIPGQPNYYIIFFSFISTESYVVILINCRFSFNIFRGTQFQNTNREMNEYAVFIVQFNILSILFADIWRLNKNLSSIFISNAQIE